MATEYPDCFAIVEEKVKPERIDGEQRSARTRREKWWQYERERPELYRTIAGMKRVLVMSLVSKHPSLDLYRPGCLRSTSYCHCSWMMDRVLPCSKSYVH